jgi:hypothetical protein
LTFKLCTAYRFKIVEAVSKIDGDYGEFMTAQNGRSIQAGRRPLFAILDHLKFLQYFCDLERIAGKTNFHAGPRQCAFHNRSLGYGMQRLQKSNEYWQEPRHFPSQTALHRTLRPASAGYSAQRAVGSELRTQRTTGSRARVRMFWNRRSDPGGFPLAKESSKRNQTAALDIREPRHRAAPSSVSGADTKRPISTKEVRRS